MGVFVVVVMMFGLNTAPTTFQRKIFGKYIPAFMQVFLENFVVYYRKTEDLDHLR